MCWLGKNDRKMRVLIYCDGKATICVLIVYIYSLFPGEGIGSILAWRIPVKSLVGYCPWGGKEFSLFYTLSTLQLFPF